MMSIKFEDSLISKIQEGEKDTIWRLWSKRDVEPGQKVSLQDTEGSEFAKAEIVWVKDTTFGDLTPEDCEGHEPFESEEEMYSTYEDYYSREVGPGTRVKVIKFRLLRG
ncbi:MAG: ASCH domain-containing protein [Candidatus Nanohaloarchaea archaeon]